MPKYLDLVKAREEEVRKLIEWLAKRTKGFEEPKLVLTGGHGLRAFVPFSHSTRDCDFVLAKGEPWHIDRIRQWLPKSMSAANLEKREDYAFLRCLKLFRIGKQEARISLDFMEGKVVGRTPEQVVVVGGDFINASTKSRISAGAGYVEVHVSSYPDYLLLKIVAARRSDVRDVAALVWKNGIPGNLEQRAARLLPYPAIFQENLRNIIVPEIEDKRFLHSWRGMFVTTDFTEETKAEVVRLLRELAR